MLSIMVEKSKHICILPILAKCVNVTTNFELGVSNMAHSVFALVNFSNVNGQPKHVVLGLFQTTQIGGSNIPDKVSLFYNMSWRTRILLMCKMKVQSLCNDFVLGIQKTFQYTSFGHACSKTCYYATNEEKGL